MSESTRAKLHVSLDYRVITIALLVIIIGMLAAWRPWNTVKASDRTIEVTGQATISERPDEFVFYPTYEFENADKAAALAQMTAKSKEVVAGLKKAGVADKDIKTNSDSWDYPTYESIGSTPKYTLRLTVTTGNEALAQKVQDYLVTTTPTGTISPIAAFSDQKLKEVETQGRDEASKDARKRAEQSAKSLDFKLVSVKAVTDGTGFGAYPSTAYATDLKSREADAGSFGLQPGENELTYTVTVVYYIK